jgi:peptidyl-prolyl cis-trans isomerase D
MQADWDAAHKEEVDRLRQSMPTLDAKLLDTPEARYGTLERLVRDRVLAAAAQGARLTTSDQRLARELQQNEAISALRGPDGKLDMARYKQLVGAQGMTPEMFENQVRSELSTRQVLAGVGATGLATTAQAQPSLNAFFERREIQLARFDAADFASRVSLTDADLDAYYKANPQQFQAPEQASIEYLVLDMDAVKKGIVVNEQDLQTYYEQNAARLAGQEERRASHILIAAAKSAPAADRDKARARADTLLEQLKKAPEAFADLAKKESQDPGSAPNGGDLDFFARGAMTKPFEDAAFALKKGEISTVVETEFGFHIIRLTDIKSPQQKSFAQLRPQLEEDLKKQQAQRKFAESADAFSNAVYEAADGFKSVADRFKLEVRTATQVTRQAASGSQGVLASPKFLAALFSADSLEKKRNTEAVEIASGQLASGRVVQHVPARTLPFAEVKAQVRERLAAQRAADLARKEGQDKLLAWQANPASASLPQSIMVSRQDAGKLPLPVIEAALRADPGAAPVFAGVDLGPQGFAVVKVNKAIARELPAGNTSLQERQQYAQAWSSAESQAYLSVLNERFKVQIKVDKPAVKPLEQPVR